MFVAPVTTTTRPPRRGERPGVSMEFTTKAILLADAQADDPRKSKYLEFGAADDADDELTGTPLESIARIKALGAVPLLHLSYERALVARRCARVGPTPICILILDQPESPPDAADYFDKIVHDGSSDSVIDQIAAAVQEFYPQILAPEGH